MDDPGPLRGVVHSVDGTLSHLPLEQVSINVFVVDVSARVTLRQTFSNPADVPTARGKYVFPLPSRAAVCAFEMHFADGRVITGVSKEKTLAAEEHAQALSEGKASALVDSVTGDVFTISIGSVPPKQTVTTKLVFVMDLMDDDLRDEVRLQLPLSVGCRYGPEPPALVDAAAASNQTRLRITIDVQMSGIIRKILCPNYSDSITISPYVTSTGRISRRRQTVKLRSRTFLTKDFVITVQADGLDSPRCFAERDESGSGTIAMQLTLVPKKFELPPIPDQEYLFLVDRSGSMSGGRIAAARRALAALLRFLPSGGSTFNVFSFGSTPVEKFSQDGSLVYSESNLLTATKHVESMEANLGGTELAAALRCVFDNRDSGIATAVFVMTDGEISEPDQVIATVAKAVAAAPPGAPLRVFSLGIGNDVSSEVIEGIARAGNGECLFAVESEEIIGKCAKLFRAGRSSSLDDVSIDWGIRGGLQAGPDTNRSPSSVSFPDLASPGRVILSPPDAIQQSPARIAKIFPGMRFIVFIITKERKLPEKVVLRGQLSGDGEPVEIIVPVSSAKPFDKKTPAVSLIHTLAARSLITNHMDGTAILPTSVNQATPEDIRKAAIIRLGEKYQLVSRYTSFIAVDQGTESVRRIARGRPTGRSSQRHSDFNEDDQNKNIASIVMDIVSSMFTAALSLFERNPRRGRAIVRRLPGHYTTSSSPSVSPVPGFLDGSGEEQHESEDSFSTMSSLEGSFSGYSSSPSPERRPRRVLSDEDQARIRSPSPTIEHRRPKQAQRDSHTQSTTHSELTAAIGLVSLQSFDGSFSLNEPLGAIVGHSALQKPADLEVDDPTWATVLAVAYVQKHIGQSDLLEAFWDKVMEFIDQGPMSRELFGLLLDRARSLVE